MPFAPLLVVALAASPPVQLAAVPLTGVGIDSKRAEFFNDYIAQRLTEHGLVVTTPSTVQAILGHERQKALLGCQVDGEESTRCLIELSGALGVEALVVGSVAALSPGFAVNLKIVSAKDGAPIASESAKVDSESALLDFFGQASQRLAVAVRKRLRGETVSTGSFLSGTRRWSWLPAAVALGTGITSAVLFVNAKGTEADLRSGAAHIADSQAALVLREQGARNQTISFALMVTAVLSAGAGATMFALGGEPVNEVSLQLMPLRDGAMAGITWRTR